MMRPPWSIAEFASWAGAVSEKLGQRTENGFMVVDAGIQVFEKKVRTVDEKSSEVA